MFSRRVKNFPLFPRTSYAFPRTIIPKNVEIFIHGTKMITCRAELAETRVSLGFLRDLVDVRVRCVIFKTGALKNNNQSWNDIDAKLFPSKRNYVKLFVSCIVYSGRVTHKYEKDTFDGVAYFSPACPLFPRNDL